MASRCFRKQAGFTLIELMVATAVASMVLMGMYISFDAQQRTQQRENLTVQAMQNGRASLLLMERDIRMAGNDPTTVWGVDGVDNPIGGFFDGTVDDANEAENDRMADNFDNDCSGGADTADADGIDETYGIKVAGAHDILFSMDLNGDRDVCDPGEYVRYTFGATVDADRDGWADLAAGGAGRLGRADGYGAAVEPIAENIEAIAFAYAFDTDDPPDGLDEDGGGDVIWAYDSNPDDLVHELNTRVFDDGSTAGLGSNVAVEDIRAVRIWVLSRTRTPVRTPVDTATYVVGNLTVDGADSDRDGTPDGAAPRYHLRRMLTTTVVCRNMGLE